MFYTTEAFFPEIPFKRVLLGNTLFCRGTGFHCAYRRIVFSGFVVKGGNCKTPQCVGNGVLPSGGCRMADGLGKQQ